jgi:large subunit ribosomal protein L22
METNAKLSSLRIAPRKVRIVVNTIRGKSVAEAISILTYTQKAAALPVKKLIESAAANARKAGRDVDNLYVTTVTVDQGQTFKRFMPRAMGRSFRVEKKTSHVHVTLDEKAGK